MWRPGVLLPGRARPNNSVPFAFQHAAERRDRAAAAPTLAIISLAQTGICGPNATQRGRWKGLGLGSPALGARLPQRVDDQIHEAVGESWETTTHKGSVLHQLAKSRFFCHQPFITPC